MRVVQMKPIRILFWGKGMEAVKHSPQGLKDTHSILPLVLARRCVVRGRLLA
jgi:hypothetical protein